MTRLVPFVFAVLSGVLVCVPAGADDPPKKLTAEERKQLEARCIELANTGVKQYKEGKFAQGIRALEEVLSASAVLRSAHW